MSTVEETLAQILAQTKRTNGRLLKVEARAEAHDRMLNGYQDGTLTVPGLEQRMKDAEPLLDDVRALVKWTSRLLTTFVLGVVGTLAVIMVERLA